MVPERTDNLIVGIGEWEGAGEIGTRRHGELHVSDGRVGGLGSGRIGMTSLEKLCSPAAGADVVQGL